MAHTRCQLSERKSQFLRIWTAMVVGPVQRIHELDLFVGLDRLWRIAFAANCQRKDRFLNGAIHSFCRKQYPVFESDQGGCGPASAPGGRNARISERRGQRLREAAYHHKSFLERKCQSPTRWNATPTAPLDVSRNCQQILRRRQLPMFEFTNPYGSMHFPEFVEGGDRCAAQDWWQACSARRRPASAGNLMGPRN